MLEVHGLHLKGQVFVPDFPALRQGLFLPVAAAGGGAQIPSPRLPPGGMFPGRLPNGLGVRANQHLAVPSLQPLPTAAVQQLIILPMVRNPHGRRPPCFSNRKSSYYTAFPGASSTIPCRISEKGDSNERKPGA